MNIRTNKEYKVVLDYGINKWTRLLVSQKVGTGNYFCFKVKIKPTSTTPPWWVQRPPKENIANIFIDDDLDMYSVSPINEYEEITMDQAVKYLTTKRTKKSTWETFSKCFPDIIPIAAVLAL